MFSESKRARNSDINSPACLRLHEVREGSIKRPRDEEVVDYLLQLPRITNPDWVSSADMSLWNNHSGLACIFKSQCTVTDYISNFEDVQSLEAASFAVIEDYSPVVENGSDFLYYYGTWMLGWRY